MTKRKHRPDNLLFILNEYSKGRTIEITEFSNIHSRLTDEYTTIDVWPTTGKYYVLGTNYREQTEKHIRERGGEKGIIPIGNDAIYGFLDKLFFAADM